MTIDDVDINRLIGQLDELNKTQSSSRARELRQQIQEQINALLYEEGHEQVPEAAAIARN